MEVLLLARAPMFFFLCQLYALFHCSLPIRFIFVYATRTKDAGSNLTSYYITSWTMKEVRKQRHNAAGWNKEANGPGSLEGTNGLLTLLTF